MSVVEDIRQGLQDYITPELRAVNARLDAIDQLFDDMTTIMNTRFGSLRKEVAQVKDMLEIDRRLTRLESKQTQVA